MSWLPWVLLAVGFGVLVLTVFGLVVVLVVVRRLASEVERTRQALAPKLDEPDQGERANESAD